MKLPGLFPEKDRVTEYKAIKNQVNIGSISLSV